MSEQNTTVERTSERELVVTRTFTAPPPRVFAAWTTPEQFKQWWVTPSCGITFISCAIDARTGGTYRFVFGHPAAPEPMAFFGRYIEVVPQAKIVWTNEESADGGAVTTATFTATAGGTRVVVHDLHPSKESLDAAIESGSTAAWGEQFEILDGLVAAPG